MKIFLLRSLSSRFPIWPERSLKDLREYSSLESMLAEELANEAVLFVAELITTADAARVNLWRNWHRELLLANAVKILLLVATKDEAVYLPFTSHGIEILHFPFQERSLVFKVALQERLLKSTRTKQQLQKPVLPNGPEPEQGAWTVGGSTPSGKTRWRWIKTKADLKPADTSLELQWQAECQREPVFVDRSWQLGEAGKMECLFENEVIFSLESKISPDAQTAFQNHARKESSEARLKPESATQLDLRKRFEQEETKRKASEAGLNKEIPSLDFEEIALLTSSEIIRAENLTGEKSSIVPKSVTTIDELGKIRAETEYPREQKMHPKAVGPQARILEHKASIGEELQQKKLKPNPASVATNATPVDAAPKTMEEFSATPERNQAEADDGIRSVMRILQTELKPRNIPVPEKSSKETRPVLDEPLKSKDAKLAEVEFEKVPREIFVASEQGENAAENPAVEAQSGKRKATLDSVLEIRPQGNSQSLNQEELKKSVKEADLSYQANTSNRHGYGSEKTKLEMVPAKMAEQGSAANSKVLDLVPKNSINVIPQSSELAGALRQSSVSDPQILNFRDKASSSTSEKVAGGASSIDIYSGNTRNFLLKSLEELQDRNSSWERADKFRVYLSAADKYEGIREIADVLPLWIYQGELAPEFIEERKSWKFYDRGPVLCLELNHVPVAVMTMLKELIRPRARSKKEKRRAWAKEKDFKKFYHALGEYDSAPTDPDSPNAVKPLGFLQALLRFIGLGD